VIVNNVFIEVNSVAFPRVKIGDKIIEALFPVGKDIPNGKIGAGMHVKNYSRYH